MGGLGRTWVLVGALVVGAAASAVFLKPVLLAPVAGDDREWYPRVAAVERWGVAEELGQLPEWWRERTHRGRANVLTDLERRTTGRAVVDISVATGTPTYVVNGALKLLLAALGVLTLAGLLKSLRQRRTDGALVRLSGRTVALGTLVGAVLLALGGQPAFYEMNGRNGWVTYPTHGFGAVVSILGVTALVLWLTRLYAAGRLWQRLVIVLVLVALAVLTNFRYELVFPAVPLSLVALLLVPVTPRERSAEGRRAKWVTGISFVGVFLALLVALRVYTRQQCESDASGCYAGVSPHLSPQLLHAFWQNIVSTVPGTTAPQVADFVERRGVSAADMYAPTAWSVAVGTGLALALLAGWWACRPAHAPSDDPGAGPPDDDGIARGTDEARLLVLGALLCLVGALGGAGVMSLSVGAQASPALGLPYRHAVITWSGIVWAAAFGALALGQRRPRSGAAAWVVLSLGVGVAAACLLPANERSLAADRVTNGASSEGFAELVNGDTDDAANARRCRLVPDLLEERDDDLVRELDAAFQRYWGQRFCQR